MAAALLTCWPGPGIAAAAARAGAEALGLTLSARDPATRSDIVTALRVPARVDERELRARTRADPV